MPDVTASELLGSAPQVDLDIANAEVDVAAATSVPEHGVPDPSASGRAPDSVVGDGEV